ncbi:MAG: hypothetical protein AB2784_19925 [Candidatus Thiodiazotropha endolucinida]
MTLSKIILVFISMLFSSSLLAMSCVEYNSMGPNVQSLEELQGQRITKSQIDVVRKNTAQKAGRVSALQYTPMAIKLNKVMNNKALMAELAGGTSTLVRADCYRNPNKDFYDAVSDQFEYVVEYISNKYK